MAKREFHVGQTGARIRVQMWETVDDEALDISEATTKEIIMQRPNGSTVTKDAELETDGTDGIMYFDTIEGDWTMQGDYFFQGIVVRSDGRWPGSISQIYVHPNLV
jgi:hypothetical protein